MDNEEQKLREVALQTAREIRAARERTAEELLRSKETLERKTEELARSLAMMRATLEATKDGILVTDANGTILTHNYIYQQMWRLEDADLHGRAHRELLRRVSTQFRNPDAFLTRIEQIYASPEHENFDVLELMDGRVYERFSKIQLVDGADVGRVWSFRDITDGVKAQESLREQARALEVLNATGMAVASKLDIQDVLQTVTDAATQLTAAQFGAFFYNTVNEQGEAFTLYTLSGAPREAFAKFPLPRATAIFGPTFRGEGIVRCDDILQHRDYGKSAPHLGMPAGHLPVRSYLAVPVVSRSGDVHGGLFFGHGEPGKFNEQHAWLVTGIAAQAAVAIDNGQLYEEARQAQRQLQQLNETLEAKVSARTAEAQDSQQQVQQLLAAFTDCAICRLNAQGYVVSWNPGAERIKGYAAEEIIGRHFSTFYTDEDRANGMPERALAMAKAGKFEAEAWRVRKDGSRFWASVLIDPIRGEDHSLLGFAKITRDMSERRTMQEQLHQSQKMEAIGQLTGGVAHDFNNLLTVILGNLETLARHVPADEGRLRRAVDQAARGAQRAATLTQQLLAFSRRQPLNPKPTDVNQLVTGMSDLIRRTLNENIAVETVLGGGLWRVEVDAHQLESALLNLAVNARDAMPDGGKLTIETANAHLDEQYTDHFKEITPGQYALICVSDTGCGMTKEVLDHAFDPFYTTKPIGEGTGLGLSQVFGFVKQSGGHIKLYSEVGEGTTVKIYLPRLLKDAHLPEPPPTIVAPLGHADETILVVEDDPDVRMYSIESLRDLGFSVLEAEDASSAMRMLQRHPEIQLLFTDVGLPGINGRQLVDEAQKIRPGLKVLFTSGYARNAIVHQGRLDPGVELLTKPFTRGQLAARIRDVLDAKPNHGRDRQAVLLVEDEPLVRVLLADMLADLGYSVLQAASAAEALKLIDQVDDICLAFVDVGLPDRNGLELAQELRARCANMKVAIASGYGDQLSSRFHEDRAMTFVAKPFNLEAIRSAIARLGVSSMQRA